MACLTRTLQVLVLDDAPLHGVALEEGRLEQLAEVRHGGDALGGFEHGVGRRRGSKSVECVCLSNTTTYEVAADERLHRLGRGLGSVASVHGNRGGEARL